MRGYWGGGFFLKKHFYFSKNPRFRFRVDVFPIGCLL